MVFRCVVAPAPLPVSRAGLLLSSAVVVFRVCVRTYFIHAEDRGEAAGVLFSGSCLGEARTNVWVGESSER